MLKPYEKYKPIPELWLTQVPDHWSYRKIKYLFYERCEKGYPQEPLLVASQNMGVVPKDVYGNRTVEAQKDLHLLKLVKVGDFVISLRSFQGGIEYAYYQGIISPAYTVMVPKEESNSGYFRHLAKSRLFIELLRMCVTGIREGQNIDYIKLKNHLIPIPPREEQDQIVRFLDWKLAQINKLIRAKKKQIALLNEQKQVIINNAVTKGLDPNVPMKDSGIEWIGTIPEHWKVLYLSQTATEQSISNKDIHNQNLLSLSYGKIINKDINTTDGLLPASFDTYQIVHNGNIILRLTDLQNDHKSLRVGLATQTGIITSAYTCLLPRENVIPEFLYLLLHSYDICKVFYGMGGGVRQSIGFDDIRRLLIPVPPLEEQKQIVDFCYAKSNFIEGFLVGIEKEILLLTEYRTRLISDVVTGKVDVRGIEIPEYEAVPDDVTEDELDGESVTDDEAEEAEVE